MADFRTHLSVAASGGVLLAFGGWQASLWSPSEALSVAMLTAFGGILPDIDSDNSHAIRLIFTLSAVLAVVVGALALHGQVTPGVLLAACAGLYVGVRYALSEVFKRFTVHRGIWHSLLAMALCGLGGSALSYQLLAQSAGIAWVQGLALVFGSLIHLLLDEIYSVDLDGARIKRSFGTAFKLFAYREPLNSLLLLALAVGLAPWLPPWSALLDLVAQSSRLWR
ncbi:LexA-binding, inner membrane-associated putative hydrolase [Modicisalibacter muralis]|uniref:LexA-binding, inner membrane-associated putative hydrolase n=1 Tax=Modicisalibacter muralis TaxID=119000 RepID=A0A1G9KBJ9_9GAMM|nr:metal-dependent hydrolase [Halomonas muralis]SDL47002.1 LexA-binding, inner membrane-associated putative hydrolase [Halomonas muralis]